MARGQRGSWPPTFRNRRIFGNLYFSSESVRTSTVAKDKGFEFYWKIFGKRPVSSITVVESPTFALEAFLMCFHCQSFKETPNILVVSGI